MEKLNNNAGLTNLVRRLHGLVETDDLGKQRQSQEYIGSIFGNSKGVNYTSESIDGMEAEWISVDRPHRKERVILYCHGGGYSTGSTLYARTLTGKLAESTSMDVLCFNYRLAPEHPYPAALEDAMRAWDFLMKKGYGARDVVVAGDSAGGNLALALTLKLRDEGRFLPKGLVLMSPWTDLTSSGKSFQARADLDPVLTPEYIDRMVVAAADGQDLMNPLISPLFADFTGFPPVNIQVGGNEILLSDSKRLYQKLIRANVPAQLKVYKGMWHVFQMAPIKASQDAMMRNGQFIIDLDR